MPRVYTAMDQTTCVRTYEDFQTLIKGYVISMSGKLLWMLMSARDDFVFQHDLYPDLQVMNIHLSAIQGRIKIQ